MIVSVLSAIVIFASTRACVSTRKTPTASSLMVCRIDRPVRQVEFQHDRRAHVDAGRTVVIDEPGEVDERNKLLRRRAAWRRLRQADLPVRIFVTTPAPLQQVRGRATADDDEGRSRRRSTIFFACRSPRRAVTEIVCARSWSPAKTTSRDHRQRTDVRLALIAMIVIGRRRCARVVRKWDNLPRSPLERDSFALFVQEDVARGT